MRTWAGAEPKRRSRRAAIAAAVAAALPALTTRDLAAVRRRDVADREGGRAAGRLVALGVERVERFRGRVGEAVGAGDQHRRPHRRRHQHRGGDRARPVVFADQGHRGRALGGGGRGEHRERHAGGVGGRVGAADPGRVAGREGGVAELFGALGRRCSAGVGCRRWRRRRGRGGGLGVVLGAAAAADHGGDDEDDRDQDQRGDPLQRAGDRLCGGAWASARLRCGGSARRLGGSGSAPAPAASASRAAGPARRRPARRR